MHEICHLYQCYEGAFPSACFFTLNSLNAHALVNHTLLQDYPKSNDSMINSEVETDMQTILKIVELGRSIRNAKNMKVKQPLQQIIVWRSNGERFLSAYTAIIKDELKLKMSFIQRIVFYPLRVETATMNKKIIANIASHLVVVLFSGIQLNFPIRCCSSFNRYS